MRYSLLAPVLLGMIQTALLVGSPTLRAASYPAGVWTIPSWQSTQGPESARSSAHTGVTTSINTSKRKIIFVNSPCSREFL